jgi:hypothetical protein
MSPDDPAVSRDVSVLRLAVGVAHRRRCADPGGQPRAERAQPMNPARDRFGGVT